MSQPAGAQGASPTPTTSGASGASPTPSTGVNSGSPSTSATYQSPSQSGKARDYVAKMRNPVPEVPQAAPAQELSDDDFWKTHGDRIFKHERFKELTEAKSKLAPYQEFVDSIGGLENTQNLHRYFGQVWDKIMENPERGNQFWTKILPVLEAFVTDNDFSPYLAQQVAQAVQQQAETEYDEDPYAEKLKPVQQELETTKQKLARLEQEAQSRTQREHQQFRMNNLQQYLARLEKKISDSGGKIPKEAARQLADLMGANMQSFMPMHKGARVNPLELFSEEAFNKCWDEVVEPLVTGMRGTILTTAKTVVNEGGPVIPDTSVVGQSPVGRPVPISRDEKKARFAQLLRKTPVA